MLSKLNFKGTMCEKKESQNSSRFKALELYGVSDEPCLLRPLVNEEEGREAESAVKNYVGVKVSFLIFYTLIKTYFG